MNSQVNDNWQNYYSFDFFDAENVFFNILLQPLSYNGKLPLSFEKIYEDMAV